MQAINLANRDNIEDSSTSTILTVSQLTFSIKNKLETTFPEVVVQGEISNFKPNTSGHLYFDLKDSGAKLPAVFFRGKAASLSRMPKEGDQVTLKGSISVYAPHGRYQFIVTELRYQGIGELLLKLEALKEKLKSKGYFEKSRKKLLPKFPSKIGVVTSPTGAVIRDIIQILTRRAKGFHLILNPVKVQGEGAALEIARAIREFNQFNSVDVIIVGRGGGSLEDLWAFNEEIVQDAIFESKIPIISAVGHETDFTLADFVADLRAPTPSAAAEIVLREQAEHLSFLEKIKISLVRTLAHMAAKDRARLERFISHPLIKDPSRLLLAHFQRLADLSEKLDRATLQMIERKKMQLATCAKESEIQRPDLRLAFYREKLAFTEKKISHNFLQSIEKRRVHLKKIEELLHSMNPKNVLKRGYSILFDQKKGSAIVSASSLEAGMGVRALLSDGEGELLVVSKSEGK